MLIGLVFFFLGLVVGSFLNVVIIRREIGQSLRGRSYCRFCGKILTLGELVPVLSFIIQKGRCRKCGRQISWQYPIVELGTAILYSLGAFLLLPAPSVNVEYFLWAASLFVGIASAIVIFVSDIRSHTIPNGPIIVLLILGIITNVSRMIDSRLMGIKPNLIFYHVGTALILSLFLASFWFLSQGRWMGLGDAKLVFTTSLLVGFPISIIALLFSFWLGGIVGGILLLTRRMNLKDRLPFGPFILIGTAGAYFFSQKFLIFTGLFPLL